jgi:hypothetical protein
MVPKFQVAMHASHAALPILNSSKLPPVVAAADYMFYKLSIKQSEIQNFAVCLKPPPITISVAWEPSDKMMLFSPSENKVSLTSPLGFLFESILYLSFPSLSLSLISFKGLTEIKYKVLLRLRKQ